MAKLQAKIRLNVMIEVTMDVQTNDHDSFRAVTEQIQENVNVYVQRELSGSTLKVLGEPAVVQLTLESR